MQNLMCCYLLTVMINLLVNKTLIVSTILSKPYCMLKDKYDSNLTVNDKYEGYGVDLIQELSNYLGFKFIFKLVSDGHHGNIDQKTKEWNGMIKELMEKRADLAIADLSITYDRKQVVDFTVPFMDLGISLLYRKPTPQAPNMFSFVSPLSPTVWASIFAAYVTVSTLLFLLSKHTPQELCDPYHEPHTILEKHSSFMNCLLFAISPLTQQGSELLPSAMSTRTVAAVWWFFAMIMISSYTANLAAFLTVEKMDSPIKSVEDLSKQTKIKYGCYGGGSSATFFSEATLPTYQRMWKFMESTRPSVITKSNLEGVERVQREKGGYAFLMESVSIQYVTERDCELAQIGGLLDRKGYGIAVPKNATYLETLNHALLRLRENGALKVLQIRWWKQNKGGGLCSAASSSSSSAKKLGLMNVGGIFILFTSGAFIAVSIAATEVVLWKRKRKRRVRVIAIRKARKIKSINDITFKYIE